MMNEFSTNKSDDQHKESIRLRIIRILYWPYKWLIFIPLLFLITLIWGSLSIMLATIFNAKTGMKFGGSPWAKLCCLAALVFVDVKQRGNIIPNKSYVVVSNHQSLFDIFALVAWLGIDLRWVAKSSLKKVPIFGIASVKMDHIFIDRSNPEAAVETLNNAKKNIVNGTSVMFFPEGTRSKTGELKSFKKGAFKMALDLGIPILPITIRGTGRIQPPGTIDLVPGKVEIVIHPQIEIADYSENILADLIQQTRDVIGSALP
jgi:1-acyl-sn-glycerol-3-phosphate acyltransferase